MSDKIEIQDLKCCGNCLYYRDNSRLGDICGLFSMRMRSRHSCVGWKHDKWDMLKRLKLEEDNE